MSASGKAHSFCITVYQIPKPQQQTLKGYPKLVRMKGGSGIFLVRTGWPTMMKTPRDTHSKIGLEIHDRLVLWNMFLCYHILGIVHPTAN